MRWEDRKARRMADTPERLNWAIALPAGVAIAIIGYALMVGILTIGH